MIELTGEIRVERHYTQDGITDPLTFNGCQTTEKKEYPIFLIGTIEAVLKARMPTTFVKPVRVRITVEELNSNEP